MPLGYALILKYDLDLAQHYILIGKNLKLHLLPSTDQGHFPENIENISSKSDRKNLGVLIRKKNVKVIMS